MRRLAEEYPGTAKVLCALRHQSPFELLAATILSAQTTDERVNMVAPAVFARYPTAADLAAAAPGELEAIIKSTGFFRSKAKSLIGMAAGLEERFGGEVPPDLEDLVTLAGVGRKTANVVRSVAFDLPGLPVDTHVARLSRRLGLTTETDPDRIEAELNSFIPPAERGAFSLRLILHGRKVCIARSPRCAECILNDFCPSAQLPGRRSGSPTMAAKTAPANETKAAKVTGGQKITKAGKATKADKTTQAAKAVRAVKAAGSKALKTAGPAKGSQLPRRKPDR
jgi:endonuclease-3